MGSTVDTTNSSALFLILLGFNALGHLDSFVHFFTFFFLQFNLSDPVLNRNREMLHA